MTKILLNQMTMTKGGKIPTNLLSGFLFKKKKSHVNSVKEFDILEFDRPRTIPSKVQIIVDKKKNIILFSTEDLLFLTNIKNKLGDIGITLKKIKLDLNDIALKAVNLEYVDFFNHRFYSGYNLNINQIIEDNEIYNPRIRELRGYFNFKGILIELVVMEEGVVIFYPQELGLDFYDFIRELEKLIGLK